MRFLHTADWHLGRIFFGVHLTEDQATLLDQLIGIAREGKVDAVLLAGDVYDRAVPPPEAVALFGDVLERIVLGLGLSVVAIAGNHDSPERLAFCNQIMAARGLHLRGRLEQVETPIVLGDRHGPVYVHAVPYAEPAEVRAWLGSESTDASAALGLVLERVRAGRPARVRSVLLLHAFVQGGAGSESERPLQVGGAGQIEPTILQGFDYVALGHLHRPQSVPGGPIEYAGALLRCSFSEVDHAKSVALVELDAAGRASIERVPLRPRREVRTLSGTLAEILARAETDPGRDDYVMAALNDTGVVWDPMGQIRARYPNALQITRPGLIAADPSRAAAADHRRIGPRELFAAFYREKRGRDLDPEQAAAFDRVLERVRAKAREAE